MVLRWVAASVLEAAKGFRRVAGCKDMPTIVFVPGIRRPALQAGLARGQKPVAPLRGPRRGDSHRPRHRLEILPAQQTQHHFALPPH